MGKVTREKIISFKKDLVAGVRKNAKENDIEGDISVKLSKKEIKDKLNVGALKEKTVNNIKIELEKSGFIINNECDSKICVTIPEEKIKKNVLTGEDVFQ